MSQVQVQSDEYKECPFCAETVRSAAIVCRYCGRDLVPNVVERTGIAPSPPQNPLTNTTSPDSESWSFAKIIGVLVLIYFGWQVFSALIDFGTSTTTYVAPSTVPEPSRNPLNLQGSGQQITRDLSINSGFAIVEMSHGGRSNFIVELNEATSGNTEELLANEIGTYNGSRAALVRQGSYYFDIDADGSWTITVKEAGHLPKSQNLPYSFSGNGPSVPSLIRLDSGRADFSMSHQGKSNFIVTLYDVGRMRTTRLLANEIGAWQGQTSESIQGGWYLLDIEADGPWKITVRQ